MHQIALPFHFGAAGPLRGNAANNLLPISGEPNVTIMEAKALSCNVVPGRLPAWTGFSDFLERLCTANSVTNKLASRTALSETAMGGGLRGGRKRIRIVNQGKEDAN